MSSAPFPPPQRPNIVYYLSRLGESLSSTWRVRRHPFVRCAGLRRESCRRRSTAGADRGGCPRQGEVAMEAFAFASSFSLGGPNPASFRCRRYVSSPVISKVSIRPPPAGFDYKLEVLEDTRSAVEREHPELMDLVEKGRLVVVEKRRFGPVPSWRSAFVEPEAIWLVGTSHISAQSAVDVVRVIKAVTPDNVVVELCRSRQGSPTLPPHSLSPEYPPPSPERIVCVSLPLNDFIKVHIDRCALLVASQFFFFLFFHLDLNITA